MKKEILLGGGFLMPAMAAAAIQASKPRSLDWTVGREDHRRMAASDSRV